jgi:hypothetical protein
MSGLNYGYYMPYYGATYYATYNPYNYYGQGDPCMNLGACRGRTAGGGAGGIVGLICFCCIIVIICAICAASKGRGGGDDYVRVEETVVVEHHGGFVYEGPPIEFNETGGWNYAQSADWCAEQGARIPEKAEMQDYMRGRNNEPVFHMDVWVPCSSPSGDDWIQIGNAGPGDSFWDTQGERLPEWHDAGGGPSMIAIVR